MDILMELALNVMLDIMQQLKQHQHVKNVEKVSFQQKERQHALIVLMENMHHQKVQAHVQLVQQRVMEIV